MADEQHDRRVHRSKRLLQKALMSLVGKNPFDKITVQEIIDQADVGRTTFYAHFQSKEDLFLTSHDHFINIISRSFFAEDGSLPSLPSSELSVFLEEMGQQSRDVYFSLTWGNDTGQILRLLQERIADRLEARLYELFQEEKSTIPFSALAQHIAGSIVSLSSWWFNERTPYTAQDLANMLHQMNHATLTQALHIE